MFQNYSEQERKAIYSLVATSIPPEKVRYNQENEICNKLWSMQFLSKLTYDFCFVEDNSSAFLPMITYEESFTSVDENLKKEIVQRYLQQLSKNDRSARVRLYLQLVIYLVETGKFDGRGRILVRNLLPVFKINSQQSILLEKRLNSFLVGVHNTISHAGVKKEDNFRYAKIGAVALGAGAILAVTGGMVSFNVPKLLNSSNLVITVIFHNFERRHRQWRALCSF
jgi:hypothetical protein